MLHVFKGICISPKGLDETVRVQTSDIMLQFQQGVPPSFSITHLVVTSDAFCWINVHIFSIDRQ